MPGNCEANAKLFEDRSQIIGKRCLPDASEMESDGVSDLEKLIKDAEELEKQLSRSLSVRSLRCPTCHQEQEYRERDTFKTIPCRFCEQTLRVEAVRSGDSEGKDLQVSVIGSSGNDGPSEAELTTFSDPERGWEARSSSRLPMLAYAAVVLVLLLAGYSISFAISQDHRSDEEFLSPSPATVVQATIDEETMKEAAKALLTFVDHKEEANAPFGLDPEQQGSKLTPQPISVVSQSAMVRMCLVPKRHESE